MKKISFLVLFIKSLCVGSIFVAKVEHFVKPEGKSFSYSFKGDPEAKNDLHKAKWELAVSEENVASDSTRVTVAKMAVVQAEMDFDMTKTTKNTVKP
ncbi:MAG: hypothetical protein LE178_05955 [Endomicrobium sp.]|nr:hypothetical protein [Endomicrobium sp.]